MPRPPADLPSLPARVAGLAGRHSVRRWALTAALAGAAALLVVQARADAAAAQRAWGRTAPVWVATHDVPAGEELVAGDVERRDWPTGLCPPDAAVDPPVGRTTGAAIVEGEAVVDARLAPSGAHGAGALVPEGWQAVAVPTPAATPALVVGDVVDLYADLDPMGGGPGGGAERVARRAVVVAVADDAVTLAVDPDDIADVATAATSGAVSLVLVP